MKLFISKILSFVRANRNGDKVTDVKIDIGGGITKIADHSCSIGDDSYPLDTDLAVYGESRKSDIGVIVSYIDPVTTPQAAKGEKRIFARNPDDGSIACTVWLKNNGDIHFSNGSGSFIFNADGSVTFNGDVTISGTLTVDGKVINDHTHDQGTYQVPGVGSVTGISGANQ